jgi:hypothetical protein
VKYPGMMLKLLSFAQLERSIAKKDKVIPLTSILDIEVICCSADLVVKEDKKRQIISELAC